MPLIVRALCFALTAFLVASIAEARPGVPAARAHPSPEIVHVVQSGQYLSLIAKRYHTTSEAIRKTNGIAPATTLRPGTTLHIAETPEHAAWRDRNELRVKKDDLTRPKPTEADKAPEREKAPERDKAHERGKAPERGKGRELIADGSGESEGLNPHRKAAEEGTPSTLNADKWAKKPARPGHVVVSRFNDTFRGTLRASNGHVVAKSAEKLDWLLRSNKANEQMKTDRRLLKLLAQVSDRFGSREVVLVSGYRPYSPKQFTKNSRHNHGEAIDFRIAGVPNIALYEYCLTLPQVGCGYYPNSLFIHMDVRLLKTRWVDFSRPGEAPSYARSKPILLHKIERVSPAIRDAEEDDDPEPDDD